MSGVGRLAGWHAIKMPRWGVLENFWYIEHYHTGILHSIRFSFLVNIVLLNQSSTVLVLLEVWVRKGKHVGCTTHCQWALSSDLCKLLLNPFDHCFSEAYILQGRNIVMCWSRRDIGWVVSAPRTPLATVVTQTLLYLLALPGSVPEAPLCREHCCLLTHYLSIHPPPTHPSDCIHVSTTY